MKFPEKWIFSKLVPPFMFLPVIPLLAVSGLAVASSGLHHGDQGGAQVTSQVTAALKLAQSNISQ